MNNSTQEPLDIEAIKAKLEALKSEHRDLDEVIDRLVEKPPFDQAVDHFVEVAVLALQGFEHRDLDEVIDRLVEKPPFDQLQLQRLKKRKLGLKDQILKLESRLIPDI